MKRTMLFALVLATAMAFGGMALAQSTGATQSKPAPSDMHAKKHSKMKVSSKEHAKTHASKMTAMKASSKKPASAKATVAKKATHKHKAKKPVSKKS